MDPYLLMMDERVREDVKAKEENIEIGGGSGGGGEI